MTVVPISSLQLRRAAVSRGPLIEAFEREIRRPITDCYRHYLEDQPVHCGDILELYRGGHWIPGRYEWTGIPTELPTFDFGDGVIRLDTTSLLRWPTS